MLSKLAKLYRLPRELAEAVSFGKLPYYFNFIPGHSYLTNHQVNEVQKVLNHPNEEVIANYETQFQRLIGNGYGKSFASGRMAFYVLMKALNIKAGDEVILLGFTCSVMVNAILRTGATPLYADVDPDTFGSHPNTIKAKINSRTKLIVAQHTFGIPCKIDQIAAIAREHRVFLVEDCALALDSSLHEIKVGNYGQAAIFSTDHSKPLNTLIGGFLYTQDAMLYEKVVELHKPLPHLTSVFQRKLFAQFEFERNYLNPRNYPKTRLLNLIKGIKQSVGISPNEGVFLDNDTGLPSRTETGNYPYPAKLSPFLAAIGLLELERWTQEKQRRKKMLAKIIELCVAKKIGNCLPAAYFDREFDIIPLRFVFQFPKAEKLKSRMKNYLEVSHFWFQSPVIYTNTPLADLGYTTGSCPVSESIAAMIINLPCVVEAEYEDALIDSFGKSLENLT